MRRPETAEEMEKALSRLMPVALGGRVTEEIENEIDLLAGDAAADSSKPVRWGAIYGVAAAISLGALIFFLKPGAGNVPVAATNPQAAEEMPEMVFLAESDRVEDVEDEGLFVDAGGSAVRKVRVRVVGESRIRDEETGIVLMLTEPREELHMVPISDF